MTEETDKKFYELKIAYFYCACGQMVQYNMVKEFGKLDPETPELTCTNCSAQFKYDKERRGWLMTEFPVAKDTEDADEADDKEGSGD